MEFNWSNPRLHIAFVPSWASGQFLINCLSHSLCLIPAAPTGFVRDCLEDKMDINSKHTAMVDMIPKVLRPFNDWHTHQFYESAQWMTTIPNHVHDMEGESPGALIYQRVTSGMEDYMSQFMRMDARKISWSDKGFFFKLHTVQEMSLQNIMPGSKVFSVVNFERLQDRAWQLKGNIAKESRYKNYRKDYAPQGLIFDIEEMLSDNHEYFRQQMIIAYDHFELGDAAIVMPLLVAYKEAYVRANRGFKV